MPEDFLDDCFAIVTTVPFFYWYARKWHLLVQLKTGGLPAVAVVLRKFGKHVSYRYADQGGRIHAKSMALDNTVARTLQKGSELPILYAPKKTGFSCPVASLDVMIFKTKRALRNFTIFTVICVMLPYFL